MKHLSRILSRGLTLDPTRSAVSSRSQAFDFADFELLSNGLALHLREHGVRRGDRVLVFAEKSVGTIALAISLWKLGAIYVPVDVESPVERLDKIAARVRPVLACVPASGLSSGRTLAACETLVLRELAEYLHTGRDFVAPETEHAPDDIAYILHTSGTTGEPKGAALSHRSVLSFFDDYSRYLGMDRGTSVLNIGPFHFDVTFQDAFMPLYVGGCTFVCEGMLVPSVIFGLLQERRVTHFFAVAPVLTMLTQKRALLARYDLEQLEVVITGAEVCAPDVLHTWRDAKPGLRVINSYGPTEANSVSVVHEIVGGVPAGTGFFPIGKPLPNVRTLHVDSALRPIDAPGVAGELLIGGAQLMEGYWTPDGFDRSRIIEVGGAAYYRTGDIVDVDERGDYRFCGRTDSEVKLFGRRINLLEIESALCALDEVDAALVWVLELPKGKEIVAAISVRAWGEDVRGKLTEQLQRALPRYMFPKHIGVTDAMPINSRGKLDRGLIFSRLDMALRSSRESFLPLADSPS